MNRLLRIVIICHVSCALVVAALPRSGGAVAGLPEGKATADEAAAPDLSGSEPAGLGHFTGRFSYADTTAYDFPEEEKERNVVKEVVVWTLAAAFVAFFVIEVFLKGDTDEPPPDDPGKEIPPTLPAGPVTGPIP